MSTQTISLTDSNNNKLLPESAESGSNANKGYVKFADGTLICWGKFAFQTGEVGQQTIVVSFSQEYISKPFVVVSWDDNITALYNYMNNLGVHGSTTTTATIEAKRLNGSYVWSGDYIAIGRWK